LSCVRTCVVVAEERPRTALTSSFSKLFQSLGLSGRAVSTSFGCRVNVALCLQGASSPDPTTVYVDTRALRNDRVTLVERGAPHSLCLMESGKLLPGVKVVIANPDTKGHCGDSNLGEVLTLLIKFVLIFKWFYSISRYGFNRRTIQAVILQSMATTLCITITSMPDS
jgi:hypothetical protein